jgi:predicted phosphodiesterase
MMRPRSSESAFFSSWIVVLVLVVASASLVACGESSGDSEGEDASVADALVEVGPEEASPELEVQPEAEASDEVSIEVIEEVSVPEPEAFAFVKAPWLLNAVGDRVTVAWQSDVVLAAAMVEVEGLFVDSEEPLVRIFTGTSAEMSMEVPEVAGYPTVPVTAPAGFQGRALIEGLRAGEVYAYRVLNADGDVGGSFRAAPGMEQATRIAIYGDSRTNHEDHQRVVEAMNAEAPDLLIHNGDMVHMSNEDNWQTFFDLTSPLTLNTPIVGTIGNHESDMFRSWFLGAFNPPTGFEDGTNYAFAYGPAYIIVVNYLRDPTRAGLLEWLEAELVKAEAYPYRLFVTHGPMHTFSNHAPWTDGAEHIEPLLRQHGVQAVFTGHNHCYEHFLIEGLHHFTLGGGGAPLYGISQHPIPDESDWLVAEGKFFHYMILELEADKATATVRQVDPEGVETFETIEILPHD